MTERMYAFANPNISFSENFLYKYFCHFILVSVPLDIRSKTDILKNILSTVYLIEIWSWISDTFAHIHIGAFEISISIYSISRNTTLVCNSAILSVSSTISRCSNFPLWLKLRISKGKSSKVWWNPGRSFDVCDEGTHWKALASNIPLQAPQEIRRRRNSWKRVPYRAW